MESLSSNDLISSLWSNASIDKCRIGLSDALIYDGGLPVRWYVTGGTGEVKLKRTVDMPSLSRRWMAIAEQSESSFVAAIRQDGLVKYLSVGAWEAFIQDSKVADPALLSVHCFLGRGTNPIIYRNTYTVSANGRWRTNTASYSIPKDDIMHIAYEDKLKFTDTRAAQISKVLDLATTTVVRYVEKMLRIQITDCSVDYVIDKKSQIWMLWTNKTSFTRGERPVSALSVDTMDTSSHSVFGSGVLDDGGGGPGQALSQQLQDMAKSNVMKRNVNAEKLHAVNSMNTFSSKEESVKNTFPTPFKCAGEYCQLLVQPTGALTVDRRNAMMHLTRKLFSDSELDVLKKDPSFGKMTEFSSAGSTGLLEINKRSLQLASEERRGVNTTLTAASRPISPLSDLGAMASSEMQGGSKKRFMDPVANAPPSWMNGFPTNINTFYEPVHVCGTCYDAYRCLDWARGLLKKAENKSPSRPATASKEPLLESSASPLPALYTTSAEGRIGQRKGKKDKTKTWKTQVSDPAVTGEVIGSHKRRNDLAMLDNYVRGKNNAGISREDSLSPKKSRPKDASTTSLMEPSIESLATTKKSKKANVYRGKVLLASSDMMQAEEAKMILEGAYFDVTLVIDGREALNEITTDWKNYDTVMVDRDMLPLLDVFAVCKGIRAHEKSVRKSYSLASQSNSTSEKFLNSRIPLICFTSATSQADLNAYMKADMDGCVSKPVDQASLITTIRAAIPQHLAPLVTAVEDVPKNNSKVQKYGLLGELENSVDSASMALKTMSIPTASNEGSEFQGLVQLDADTKVPFLVLNGSKYGRIRQASTSKERFFNLVVCHDVFDTFERMKILLQPIVQRYQAIQVLVWNYPGQAQTEWRSTQVLNNEYLAACLNEVLGQVGHLGTKDFNTEEPFYLLGFGYGANIASYYMAHYRAPNIRGLLSANGWAFVDSYLAGIMHDCVNIFQSSPSSRPDLPVYFFCRFLFSKDYLAKVSVPLALNIYTAIYNSITVPGRIALCNGLLKSVDIRPLLKSIDCPIICLHSDQNSFIRPVAVEPFVANRGGEVRSIHHALQDFRRTCVVWLHGGHELFQENRKQVVLLLEQILTGYHEVHELTFPSASSVIAATNAMSTADLKPSHEMSMEDKFTHSVLSLSKSVSSSANKGNTVHKPTTPSDRIGTASTSRTAITNTELSHPSPTRTVSFNAGPSVDSWEQFSDSLLDKQHSILTFDKSKSEKKPVTNLNNVPMNDVHEYPEVKEYMQWRLKRNKKRLQRLQLAAQSIQCGFRAHLARKLVKNIRELRSASLIQRVYRGHLGRKRFFQHVRMLWAAIYMQKIYRGYLARKYYFMFQVRIAGAANIQRVFRGCRGRKRVKRIRAQRNHASSIIQAMFRRFQARRDAWLRRQFRNCAVVIQRNFRGFLGRKRAGAERDKYIFSKSQSQGIEFGRQMLLEHKLHVTKLQSDVTLLSQEKVSAEEQIEALLEEIASFEEGVRVLEKEMHQLSKVESEAAAFMDEDSKFELREQKMRLDREFGEMLGKIANRKDMLNDIEKKLAAVDKARQGKEEDLRTLERKLVVLLEDQQKELNMIKRKQDVRGALLAASHAELNKVTAGAPGTAGFAQSAGSGTMSTAGGGGGYSGGPSLQEKKQAAQLMQSTETLMKFGFMSMSMTYFSSLNMIKALRTVSAQDTVMAALADVHAQRAVGFNGGGSAEMSGVGSSSGSSDRVMSKLKKGELPGQQKLQVSSWSVEDVSKWLQSLSLGQYCEAFMDSAIDGEFLYDLNDDDLKNTLGIEHRLHRKKILNCIQRLKMAELQSESRLGKLQHVLFAPGSNPGMSAGIAGSGIPDIPGSAPGTAGMPNFGGVGFADNSSMGPEDDSRMIEGPRIPISELFSFVRHSKFSMLKEAIDYLPNKPFDKSLVQSPCVVDFGTVYMSGYERLPFHINKTDEYGNTLLIYACQNGNAKIAKYLINKGANANHQNKQGQTAAHFAIAYQFFDLSTWLFENGADDTVENKFGLTAYDGLSSEDTGDGGALAIENG